MMREIVVGRTPPDLKKYGVKGTGFIGKHIVGTGEEAHLTNPILLDLLRPHVILITGKRGSGKCVTGDTLVLLKDGSLVPIREIVEKKERTEILSLDLKGYSLLGSKVSNFFKRKVNETYRITLWNGLKIEATPNHPFLTPFGWKDARTLRVGEFVATPLQIPSVSVSNEKCALDENKIKLLAYLLAEGTIRKNFVWFTNKNPLIVSDFLDALRKFDENLTVKKYGRFTYRIIGKKGKIKKMKIKRERDGKFGKGTKIIVKRNILLEWLASLNLLGKRAGEKIIPSVVFFLSNERVALFLRCLFACDGSIYRKKSRHGKTFIIEYSSKSRRMIEQIYFLLLRFGIPSYIRSRRINGKLYHRLFITGMNNVRKFVKGIGVMGKEDLVREILNDKRTFHSNFEVIPKEIWNYIRKKFRKKDIGKALNYKDVKGVSSKYKYNPLKVTIRRIAEFFSDEFLLRITSPSVLWVRVERKERISSPTFVYDVTVNDHHNFIGNGVILHNSYSAGVMAEEIVLLPEEFRKNLTAIIVDTMGIYWSTKLPNEQQVVLLDEWGLKPKDFKDRVKVYVPYKQREEFERAGIPVDFGISIPPHEFSGEDWSLAFNLPLTNPIAIGLQKAVNELKEREGEFEVDDLLSRIKDDRTLDTHTKSALTSMLSVAEKWGVFGKEGIRIEEMMRPGTINVFDVSRLRATEAWSVRNLLIALIARKIYAERVLARKQEELAKIGEIELKEKKPMVWLFVDEAHQFVSADLTTVSTNPLLTIVKQGREPGISFIPMTQMPNKLHQDVISQCDIVISHRLTSKDDLEALHAVMQTYLREEMWKYIDSLPRGWIGAGIILDDNSERIYTIQVRPRYSHHAGEAAVAVR